MKNITTILFDVGWPIIDETVVHRKWNEHLVRRINELSGKDLNLSELEKYESDAVACYAPSLYSYVIWQIVKPDEKMFYNLRGEFDAFDFPRYNRIQPDAQDVIQKLHAGFKMGLAANQPASVLEFLKNEGLLKYFTSALVSEEIGYSKPDPRMFLRILEDIGSIPEESAMVGDRQDNDMVPPKLLGMTTIRLRIGMHKNQVVRYPKEKPDYEIESMPEMLAIPFISNKLG